MKDKTLYLISIFVVIIGIYYLFYIYSCNNITENFAKYQSYAEKYAKEYNIKNTNTIQLPARRPARSDGSRGHVTVSQTRFRR